MVPKCSVHGCKSYNGKCDNRFLKFPKRCPLSWLAVVGKEHWIPKRSNRICSKHFKPCDKTQTGRLSKSAVPISDRDKGNNNSGCNSTDIRIDKMLPFTPWISDRQAKCVGVQNFENEFSSPSFLKSNAFIISLKRVDECCFCEMKTIFRPQLCYSTGEGVD